MKDISEGGSAMFKRFITATDFSLASTAVISNMEKLKFLGLKEGLLLQCLTDESADLAASAYIAAELEKDLESKRKILESQGFKVSTRVVKGTEADEVSRIAVEENFDIIITGAKERNRLSAPLLGEAAYNIIHKCRKPIFLLRLGDFEKDGEGVLRPERGDYLKKILYATDFSKTAAMAFDALKAIAAAGTQKITLMHVQDRTRLDPYMMHMIKQFEETDTVRLNNMKAELAKVSDAAVETLITFGNPSRDILKEIKNNNYQLVVIGSQGRGYVSDFFVGSVGHNIARQSEASVLLIPATAE
ncbi:MAG: putative universal stress protein [Firmicutes bacterium ADurb.Bin262]|nr:MAG: putative universal stress protein [Firmicutes bacterium ADurb.Bin262]